MQQHAQDPVFTAENILSRFSRSWLILLVFIFASTIFTPFEGWAQAADGTESIGDMEYAGESISNNQSDMDEGSRFPQDLVAYMSLGDSKQSSLRFYLNYRDYPSLVTAFLYFSQHEADLYGTVPFALSKQVAYGHAFISPSPSSGINSLPNVAVNVDADKRAGPGLAFWRNGSIVRSDILVLTSSTAGLRDQKNLVFFASVVPSGTKLPLRFSSKQGLQLLRVGALGEEAQEFLDLQEQALSGDREDYMQSLEQRWQEYIETNWPQLAAILAQSTDWKRDAFGYYSRYVSKGRSALPKLGEDLNMTLERKAFARREGESRSVIINFGRDALPMPFAYFVQETPKGSQVEILCPPSAVRSNLSVLTAGYDGNTRYQWLLDTYFPNNWLYLSFALEIF